MLKYLFTLRTQVIEMFILHVSLVSVVLMRRSRARFTHIAIVLVGHMGWIGAGQGLFMKECLCLICRDTKTFH